MRRPCRGIAWLVAIKLCCTPLMVWLLLSAFGNFSEPWVYARVIRAALAPGAENLVILDAVVVPSGHRSALSSICRHHRSTVTLTGLLGLVKTGRMPPDLFPEHVTQKWNTFAIKNMPQTI